MENRIRDLEQLQEREPGDRGRRVGMVAMATLGIVALTFAIGVVVGKAAEPGEGAAKEPLDQLDRIALGAASVAPGVPAGKADTLRSVDATELSFPKSLVEEEERPEVLAALEAAAREEATLEAQAPAASPAVEMHPTAPLEASPRAALDKDAHEDADDDAADDAQAQQERTEQGAPTVLPAAVAAGSAGRALAKAAKHDRLVAAALPESAPRERAPHGEEGAFTLQVISYDTPAPAQAFASSLRSKGHEAFVTSAEVPDRGRYYRVRIGPFATRDRADAYRRKFEDDEHMNTIVVKRAKDDSAH